MVIFIRIETVTKLIEERDREYTDQKGEWSLVLF